MQVNKSIFRHPSILLTCSAQQGVPYLWRNGLIYDRLWIRGQRNLPTPYQPFTYTHFHQELLPDMTILPFCFGMQLWPCMHCILKGQRWNRVIDLTWYDATHLFTYSSVTVYQINSSIWNLCFHTLILGLWFFWYIHS